MRLKTLQLHQGQQKIMNKCMYHMTTFISLWTIENSCKFHISLRHAKVVRENTILNFLTSLSLDTMGKNYNFTTECNIERLRREHAVSHSHFTEDYKK